MKECELVWLRRDLRIHDHPALACAAGGAETLVPVFCFDRRLLHGRHSSGPRTQFLLESLTDLDGSLHRRGSGRVPTEHLAEPWKMSPEIQRAVGCVIGRDYPEPIVDHRLARAETLRRYAEASPV